MISVQDIYKSFGSLEVIKGVSFDVAKGEVVCIIGPSGSGKSTILRCINGLETYNRGAITIEGAKVNPLDRSIVDIRTQVSMVFQRFNLFPHRTALENVMEGPIFVKGVNRAEARDQAMELLEKVGLAGKFETHPGQLSGGQQQRVAVARALANSPLLILADEPTGNLDSASAHDILDLLESCRREASATLVVATHDPAVAGRADRLITMRDGAILTDGGR